MEIFEGERIDDLQCSGLYIIQNKNGFCFGIDAVLLSSFAKVKRGEKSLGYVYRQWSNSIAFVR